MRPHPLPAEPGSFDGMARETAAMPPAMKGSLYIYADGSHTQFLRYIFYAQLFHMQFYYAQPCHSQLFHTQLFHTICLPACPFSFLPLPSHVHICRVLFGRSSHVGFSGLVFLIPAPVCLRFCVISHFRRFSMCICNLAC